MQLATLTAMSRPNQVLQTFGAPQTRPMAERARLPEGEGAG